MIALQFDYPKNCKIIYDSECVEVDSLNAKVVII